MDAFRIGVGVAAGLGLGGVLLNSLVRDGGNQRVDGSTIVTYAAIPRGKSVTAGELNDALRRVLDSGLFETVDLDPRGSTLVITVVENPTINRINFEGNRRIKDEDLSGLIDSSSRRVFSAKQAELDANKLTEAYAQQGRIAANGLVNSREQLESLFTAKEMGVASVQAYLDQPGNA